MANNDTNIEFQSYPILHYRDTPRNVGGIIYHSSGWHFAKCRAGPEVEAEARSHSE